MEINTLTELVRAVSDTKTAGYFVDFEIEPRLEKYRAGNGFWFVIEVATNEPGSRLNGQWWFYDDNTVMQVL